MAIFPEVSVIVPVLNGADHLRRAVLSALACAHVGEVIIVDDGSEDGSWSEARRLCRDPRVIPLCHPNRQSLGVSASRNLGIEASRCELIAFLDADDYYLPGRFDCAVRRLAADDGVDGVYETAGTWWATPALKAWWLLHYNSRVLNGLHQSVAPEDLFRSIVEGKNGWLHTSAITVRRRLLRQTGPFDLELSMCQDSAMWLKMAACGRLVAGRIDEAVSVYVVHGNNRVLRQRALKQHFEDLKDEIVWRWLLLRPGMHPAKVVQGCQLVRRRWARGADAISAWLSVADEYPRLLDDVEFNGLHAMLVEGRLPRPESASAEWLAPPGAAEAGLR